MHDNLFNILRNAIDIRHTKSRNIKIKLLINGMTLNFNKCLSLNKIRVICPVFRTLENWSDKLKVGRFLQSPSALPWHQGVIFFRFGWISDKYTDLKFYLKPRKLDVFWECAIFTLFHLPNQYIGNKILEHFWKEEIFLSRKTFQISARWDIFK